MTTPETPETPETSEDGMLAIPLAGKALAASGIALPALPASGIALVALAGSMTAYNVYNVQKANVSKTRSSLTLATELGERAKDTGLYQAGLDRLKESNASTTAFNEFEFTADLPPGTIKAERKGDLASTITRKVLKIESLDVRTRSGELTRLQEQRESELTESSTLTHPERSEVSELIPSSPTSKSTEFTISSSPPLSFVIYQLVLIIWASVFGVLIGWGLARFLFKPSK